VVHLPAGRSDPRSPLLDQRPEGRLLCAFAVEGAAGTRGGTRIWAELPDALGFRPARPVRAVVVGRVHTEQRSLVYERMRVVVLALRQL
jgi:hypothetical protein